MMRNHCSSLLGARVSPPPCRCAPCRACSPCGHVQPCSCEGAVSLWLGEHRDGLPPQGQRVARVPRAGSRGPGHAGCRAGCAAAGGEGGHTRQRGGGRPREGQRPAEAAVGTPLVAPGGACVLAQQVAVARLRRLPRSVPPLTLGAVSLTTPCLCRPPSGALGTGGEAAERLLSATARWWRAPARRPAPGWRAASWTWLTQGPTMPSC